MSSSLKKYTRLLSLGKHCQCGYQLRRYTGCREASVFDSLGTPHLGLVQELMTGFSSSFKEDALTVSEDGRCVVDLPTGVIYRHHFSRLPGTDLVAPGAIAAEYTCQWEKKLHLIERWHRLMVSEIILFVRHDTPTIAEVSQLYEALSSNIARERYDLVFLLPNEYLFQYRHPNVFFRHGFSMPTGANDWKGSDDAWDGLLDEFAPHLREPNAGHLRCKIEATSQRPLPIPS
jgi:hypothetical protein